MVLGKNHLPGRFRVAMDAGNGKKAEQKATSAVPNQILVRFKKGVDPEAVLARIGAMGIRVQKQIGSTGIYLMVIVDGSAMEDVLQKLRNLEEVELVVPNYTTPPPRVRGRLRPAS